MVRDILLACDRTNCQIAQFVWLYLKQWRHQNNTNNVDWHRSGVFMVNFEHFFSSFNFSCCDVRRFCLRSSSWSNQIFSTVQTQFILKQKEIDFKSFYSNLGNDKVASLPGLHTFSGADIKGSFLCKGKMKCWQFFKKEAKLLIKHLLLLLQPKN